MTTETEFPSKSPLDGRALDAVTPTAPDAVAAMVARARGAQGAWAGLALDDRIKAVRAAKDRILDRAESIAQTIHIEIGKPKVEALLGEVLASADVVDYWCGAIEDLVEPMEVELDNLTYPGKQGTIHRDARGVIGVIMPWNFPFALPLRTIVPALLAGNAVVFKPSEISPRSGALVADVFAGLFPDGVLTVIQGGGVIGAALCASDVDLVVFTGSVPAGRKVAHACAERLVPCALELGGKDAAIVMADANLDRAANGLVWGSMMNAGQNCAAVERVYVDKAVARELIEKIVAAVKALKVGDEVGPLATERQRAIVENHVEGARAHGAEVLAGGERLPGEGFGYAPTVVTIAAGAGLDLLTEETFGPVLPIVTFDTVEQAIEQANASRFGLTASVWTKNVRRGEEIARKLRAGVVTINNHSFTGALPGAPWSGHGESGYGITGSPLALEALTRPRFVLVDRSRGKRELWWYPYTPVLETIALSMARLRSGSTGLVGRVRALMALLGAFPKRMFGGG